MKEVRDVTEMSGKTVFWDGRSHYKKQGLFWVSRLPLLFWQGTYWVRLPRLIRILII